MAQRLGGGAPGGLQPSQGMPPPPMRGQQPTGAAPQSQIAPMLEQVKEIVLQGNPADLAAVGEFVSWIVALDQAHAGQGAAATPGAGMTPGMGTTPPPIR